MTVSVKFNLTKEMLFFTWLELKEQGVKRIGKSTILKRMQESLFNYGVCYFDYYEEKNIGYGLNYGEEILRGFDQENYFQDAWDCLSKFWELPSTEDFKWN